MQSINTSGHKWGLVYPGVGWILWRDEDAVPDELVFDVDYLGGDLPTFTLNFSRPGGEVVAQYFNFLRLGREGYTRVQQACRDNAEWLSSQIDDIEQFELVSDGGSGVPAFAFKLRDDVDEYSVFDVSRRLRVHGWQVPAYNFAEGLDDMEVLRIVVRNGFGRELAERLVEHLREAIDDLEAGRGRGEDKQEAFHH